MVVNDLGGAADGSASRVADEVVKEIEALGGKAVANGDSVATVEGGRRIFQTALDAFGGCDVLVNNAGILRDKTLFNMEEEDWDAVIAVHLKGHYCCTRPFARFIRETDRRGGRIINFSSVSGLLGNFGQSNYGAAKSGIAFARPRARAGEVRLHGEHDLAGRGHSPHHPVDAGPRRRGRGGGSETQPRAARAGRHLAGLARGPGVHRQVIHVMQGRSRSCSSTR